jgi:pyrimidine operon attenuation protein/uracil phosphoribosyltransferase
LKNYILDKTLAKKKLQRMALEMAERNTDMGYIILAGIEGNGMTIANILKPMLAHSFDGKIEVMQISLDKKNPLAITLSNQLDFNNSVIILVDDVAMSGKTLTYALKPFLDFHPQKIQTLVLVERTHKTFPVSADYVGQSVATTIQEHIFVEVENGEVTGAYLE